MGAPRGGPGVFVVALRRGVGTGFGRGVRRGVGKGVAAVVLSVAMGAAGVAVTTPSGATAGAAPTGWPVISTAGDTFGALVTFRTPDGLYASPIHGAVMPDGRLFLMGRVHADRLEMMHASWTQRVDAPGSTPPAQVTIQDIMAPTDLHDTAYGAYTLDDSLVCGGHTFLSDGRLMIAGGPRTVSNTSTGTLVAAVGVGYGSTFDGAAWNRIPGFMAGKGGYFNTRWYPTLTRLADGRILVTGGFDVLTPIFDPNVSEEIFNPADNTWTQISSQQQTPPQAHDADYTAVFTLPRPVGGSDVAMIGESGVPILMSSATTPATWRVSPQPRPGATSSATYSSGAATALLPVRLNDGEWGYHNGSFLTAGGALGSSAMSHADVYDPTTDTWRATIDTGVARHYPATVDLPDGRVLVMNGHDSTATPGVLSPQYIDPANDFAVTTSPAVATEIRGYHNVAMLVPDGRVLVAGGRDVNRDTSLEKPDYTYFSPSYMTRTRPAIVNAPLKLGYGQNAFLGTTTTPVSEAVLMALPAMTHSFDQNQRSVQIKLRSVVTDAANNQISVITGPSDAQVAPPGDYMLFVLDANRVPSVARIVRVG